jgi:solute carrier family 25 (mitochondrial phosphate transporter), member 23/24/25/41
MASLTASPHSHAISFREFRDFLLLLPRKVSTAEIYRFYEMKKFIGDDGKGAARVTMEGLFPRTEDLRLRRFMILQGM